MLSSSVVTMREKLSSSDHEALRLDALRSYQVLDTEAEQRYDDLTILASRTFGVPVALLCLVDRDRLWFKSKFGLDLTEVPREMSFCDTAISLAAPLVVEDAASDPRFAEAPMVTDSPGLRFYAGAPLIMSSGFTLGTLSIMDRVPRSLTQTQLETLSILARQVVAQLEMQKQQFALAEALETVRSRNQELSLHNHTLEQLNRGSTLSEVLDELVRQIEALHPELLCSILVLDSDTQSLRHGASMRLPRFYVDALDGLSVGEGGGVCGAAAHLGERVVVEDIQTDPTWRNWSDVAARAGLRSCWSQPIMDGNGTVLGSFALYHRQPSLPSITEIALIERYANLAALAIEQSHVEAKMHRLAFFDALTDVPNRRLFEDRLSQAIVASSRSGQFGAVLLIDLDHFKAINDRLGHAMGDLLLKEAAQRLSKVLREEDTVARLGGDEFAAMLVNLGATDAETAARQAESICEKILDILNQPYQLGCDSCVCTPSIGVSLFRGHRATIDNLLKQADMAMYRSKAEGRNAIHFFDPEMEFVVTQRANLEADLRKAVQNKEFQLYYQPQIDAQGNIVGAEALLRWQSPMRGPVPPGICIPLAEETGQILPIGDWVLEEACRQLALWAQRSEFSHLTLAVNISPRQITQPNFIDTVLDTLRRTGAPATQLKLELTESLFIENVQAITEKMLLLRANGVGFSLDDFGVGYSSLSYLKLLPLEQLKIDQSFVRDILWDHNDATIAKTIIGLAHSLGFAVLAEGVENAPQREFLAHAGCDYYQGYLFSPALTAEEFLEQCRRGPYFSEPAPPIFAQKEAPLSAKSMSL